MENMWCFISRELSLDSIFRQRLTVAGYQVIGKSLVQLTPVRFTTLPTADWIFFYSKNAVHFLLESARQMQFPLRARLAAIGPGTAAALTAYGLQPDFVGTGEPVATANAFLKVAKGQRILFPRAARSQDSVKKYLAGQIEALDLVVYRNEPRTDFQLPVCRWLVFTSPLNAQAYFQRYTWQSYQRVLAIGATTAGALQRQGIMEAITAPTPDEAALATAILNTEKRG